MCVTTEKKKAATFKKLLYRTGAIYSSMIAAGTMPPPVRRSASTDAALDVVDSGLAEAPPLIRLLGLGLSRRLSLRLNLFVFLYSVRILFLS